MRQMRRLQWRVIQFLLMTSAVFGAVDGAHACFSGMPEEEIEADTLVSKRFALVVEQQVGLFAWETIQETVIELRPEGSKHVTLKFANGAEFTYLFAHTFDWAVFWTREEDQSTGFFVRDEESLKSGQWRGEMEEGRWVNAERFNIRIHLKQVQ